MLEAGSSEDQQASSRAKPNGQHHSSQVTKKRQLFPFFPHRGKFKIFFVLKLVFVYNHSITRQARE